MGTGRKLNREQGWVDNRIPGLAAIKDPPLPVAAINLQQILLEVESHVLLERSIGLGRVLFLYSELADMRAMYISYVFCNFYKHVVLV